MAKRSKSTTRWNSQAFMQSLRNALAEEIVAGTESIREEAISLILDTPKTGRTYRRRGTIHQASAPGEPPASDTGRLVNAITTDYRLPSMRARGGARELRGRVIARSQYALFLELGTQKMQPRPFLRPALANKLPEIRQRILDVIARVNANTAARSR